MKPIERNEQGELIKEPLSKRAMGGVEKPDYWRNGTHDALDTNIRDEYAAAFMKVQESLGGIIKTDSTANAGKYKYNYTSLGMALPKILKAMNENSLMLQQYTGKTHGISGNSKVVLLEVHTRITHAISGQREITVTPIPLEPFSYKDKDGNWHYTDQITPQSFGSAFSYGKRYALLSYWGLATADNDAMNSILEELEEPEHNELAGEFIEEMNKSQTKGQLLEWGHDNKETLKMLPPKASRIIIDAFKDLKEQLPVELEEDKKQ